MVVFDLDDTLYHESDFVASGKRFLTCVYTPEQIEGKWTGEMLAQFRDHHPDIVLSDDARRTLDTLVSKGCTIGIISDGRSNTQRNKIKALGLDKYIADNAIIISGETGFDKTSAQPFTTLMSRFPAETQWVYVADNPEKDFLHPNKLGWTTVMLRDIDGRNIHPQPLLHDLNKMPRYIVNNLYDITSLV